VFVLKVGGEKRGFAVADVHEENRNVGAEGVVVVAERDSLAFAQQTQQGQVADLQRLPVKLLLRRREVVRIAYHGPKILNATLYRPFQVVEDHRQDLHQLQSDAPEIFDLELIFFYARRQVLLVKFAQQSLRKLDRVLHIRFQLLARRLAAQQSLTACERNDVWQRSR